VSPAQAADVAVVGTGVSGLLVARELARAGREVTLIERGADKSHAEQLRTGTHDLDIRSAQANHESAPGQPAYPWDYVYGVGGSSLHWAGVSPRFLPSDFEFRTRYGVGRDWPISYKELAPFYDEAEHALAVSGGGDNKLFPGRGKYPHPPHPYAPVDRLIAGHLGPYFPLPQARPTESVGGRAACCGSARCGLCPVNARYSGLHTIADERLFDRPGVKLVDRTVVARIRATGRRVTTLECIGNDRERSTIRANTVVLAANGIENAAILLRSDLGGGDVGKYLYDHEHRLVYVRVNRPAGHGYGYSLATGVSYRYAEGEFRSKRGGLLVYPYNPGRVMVDDLMDSLVAGDSGKRMQARLRRRFERTLVLDTLGEDVPRRERSVELSPHKDSLGMPKNRVTYPADSDYLEDGRRALYRDLERRLAPLGAKFEKTTAVARGAHQLGTCRMGKNDGVVDPDQRHHRFENLYVTGGSSFPSYSSHHPTLTIAALAIRLGRHLGARG
jgi:choline dehydrogenase-like flavoprotein